MKLFNTKIYFSLFFIAMTVYVAIILKPSLYYHLHQPAFLIDSSFLASFLTYPGGMVDWLTLLITQSFIHDWLGAGVITTILFTLFFILNTIFRTFINSRNVNLFSFFSMLCGIVLIQYNIPFTIIVKFTIVMTLFLFYLKFKSTKIVYLVFSWILYLLLGGWAFLYLLAFMVLNELLFTENKSRFIYIILFLGAAASCLYFSAHHIHFITIKEAATYLFPHEFHFPPYLFNIDFRVLGLFLTLPILIIGIKISSLMNLKIPISSSKMGIVEGIIIITSLSTILFITQPKESKTKLQISYFAQNREWSQIIETVPLVKNYDREVNFNLNRALFFEQKLLDNMFNFDQLAGVDGLFINKLLTSEIAMPASDLYYDLGHINAAKIMAFEAQTKMQFNPAILKRLFTTYQVIGDSIAAKKFAKLLSKNPLYKTWIHDTKSSLQDSTSLLYKEYAQKKELLPTTNFLINSKNPENDLLKLLDHNSANKMAFEYLAACYLLEGNLEQLASLFPQFEKRGYKKTPTHIQEVALLAKAINPNLEAVKSIALDQSILNRFMEFNQTLIKHRQNPKLAKSLLETNFGDTYWYYFRYTKNSTLKLSKRKIDNV